MLVIGITGGIACGKSTVARAFRSLGAELIDADAIVRGLYKKPAVVAKIKRAFGKRAVAAARAVSGKGAAGKNKISRAVLADLVFSDARKLKKLGSLVHPLVVREIKKKISRSRKKFVAVDVPLLFEVNLAKMFDFVVVTRVSRGVQFARLRKRGLSPRGARARISSQMPLREKVKLADCVINAGGTKKQTALQVRRVCGKLGCLHE